MTDEQTDEQDQTDEAKVESGAIRPTGGRPSNREQEQSLTARRANVELMYLNGYTVRDIAEATRVSVSTAHADIEWVRDEWRRRAVEVDLMAAKDRELARLEKQRTQLAGAAARGSLGAHRELLRIAVHTAKLLGLYAPQQVALSGEVSIPGAHLSRDVVAHLLTTGAGAGEPDDSDTAEPA